MSLPDTRVTLVVCSRRIASPGPNGVLHQESRLIAGTCTALRGYLPRVLMNGNPVRDDAEPWANRVRVVAGEVAGEVRWLLKAVGVLLNIEDYLPIVEDLTSSVYVGQRLGTEVHWSHELLCSRAGGASIFFEAWVWL